MIRTLLQISAAAVIGTSAVVLGSCGGEPTAPSEPQAIVLRATTSAGLEQVAQLTPARPATGDTLLIVSVLRNETGAPVTVSTRICGLDLDTQMATNAVSDGNEIIRCGGYSMTTTLAAGDSIRAAEYRRVIAGPGTYTLRLRHLLDPEQWLDTPMTVRAR